MEKVLITGKNSYIGKSFSSYAEERLLCESVSLQNCNWKEKSWQGYDAVLHTVGVAHIRQAKKNEKLFFAINKDLAVEAAKKAKQDGVKLFVFISSASVYGNVNTLKKSKVIDQNTLPKPVSAYGKSKLEAEKLIMQLQNDTFKVCILRPPMVYGKDCKGNFPMLVSLAKKMAIFPNFSNKRSMIYINNLCEFICLVLQNSASGIFLPQNAELMSTMGMVKTIRESYGKKTFFSSFCSLAVFASFLFVPQIRRMFGNFIIDKRTSNYFGGRYQIISAKEGVKKSL